MSGRCNSPSRPTTDNNVLAKKNHSRSPSSVPRVVSDSVIGYDDEVVSMHESSHDRVREMEPIGGDLSIKFELI